MIYSFIELLLNVYYMPDIVLSAGDIEWNNKKGLYSTRTNFHIGGDRNNKSITCLK